MMIGNIGCGKSLIARKFAINGYTVVNMDSITKMVAGGEYGNYDPGKKEIYHAAETAIISASLEAGISVVVDRTNISPERRKPYIDLAQQFDTYTIAYDWGPGTIHELKRRFNSPAGIPQKQWTDVHENFITSYQEPSPDEGFEKIINMAETRFTFHAFDFDGIIAEKAKYPAIGNLNSKCVDLIRKLWMDLTNIIIIWTCRSGDGQNCARSFLLKNKIPFDFINENPLFDSGSRKIFAHHYYDDRNAEIIGML